MSPPRWLHWPDEIAPSNIVGTCTSWNVAGSPTIRNANGWSAGSAGTGSTDMELRDDFRGAFLVFATGTDALAFLSANFANDITITHSSGTYFWDHTLATMTVFATLYIQLPLTGWSGTLPDASDSATITVA